MFIAEDRLSQELFDFIHKPTVIALAWTFRFGASCYKGVIVLSQANICRLEFDCAGCTVSLKALQVSHKCLKVLESKLLLALNLNLNSNLWVSPLNNSGQGSVLMTIS